MIVIYTAPSCTSCKKAKAWFANHQISYEERNIISNPLTEDEIKKILAKCHDGLQCIISTRNRFGKALNIDFDELNFSEAVKIISENPQILRRPIMMDEKRLYIGYNEEEIRAFLPREVRIIENQEARLKSVM